MENTIKANTEGLRSQMARRMGITPQGFQSKLNARPIDFLIIIFKSLVELGHRPEAETIWADIRSRAEIIFFPAQAKTKFSKRVENLNRLILLEAENAERAANRFELLNQWRQVARLASERIAELTGALAFNQS